MCRFHLSWSGVLGLPESCGIVAGGEIRALLGQRKVVSGCAANSPSLVRDALGLIFQQAKRNE